MPTDDDTGTTEFPPFLAADEPLPFTVQNPTSVAPVLLVCDHASRRFPKSLGGLGLDPLALRSHLAIDIGAGDLTRRLASSLNVTAVLAEYSRLVVDCNRDILDSEAFLQFADGVVIPGNRNLSELQKTSRAENIYWPYHHAIDAEIERLSSNGKTPAVIAIHSFTPVLDGVSRAWEIGVLWDSDSRIAAAMLHGLREAGLNVGDNEPYSGKAPQDFTIDHHAEGAGLPHVGIEVRQDLIDDEEGVDRIAAIVRGIIEQLPLSVFSCASDADADRAAARASRERERQRGQRQ